MRRHRDDDRLACMVKRDQPDQSVEGLLDNIAGVLARFHAQAEWSPVISAQGKISAIDQRWHENLSELNRYAAEKISGLSGRCLSRIKNPAAEYAIGCWALFTGRIDEGCIVDGYADLLVHDIFCVDGEPGLLDCLSSTTSFARSIASTMLLSSPWTSSSWAANLRFVWTMAATGPTPQTLPIATDHIPQTTRGPFRAPA